LTTTSRSTTLISKIHLSWKKKERKKKKRKIKKRVGGKEESSVYTIILEEKKGRKRRRGRWVCLGLHLYSSIPSTSF